MEILNAIQRFIYPAVDLVILIFCLIKIKNPGGKLLAIGFGVNIIFSLCWRIIPLLFTYERLETIYAFLGPLNIVGYLIFATLFIFGMLKIIKGAPLQQQISKIGGYTPYVMFLYLGFLLMVFGIPYIIKEKQEAGLFLFGVGVLILTVSNIIQLIILYRLWKQNILLSKNYNLVPSIETPGKAVGFLFIPFYNFYWVFQAYGKLPADLNAIARAKQKEVSMSEGLGTALAVMMLISIIPFLGYLTSLVNLLILVPIFLYKTINVCDQLAVDM